MIDPDALMRFPSAVRHDSAVEAWFRDDAPLRWTLRPWFEMMRGLGDDVRELIHDHAPTACIGDAAFAYVNAFTAHAAIGFFRGAALPDPARLLEGTGKRMRHVKLRPGVAIDEAALAALIRAAYDDMRERTGEGQA